MTDGDIEIIYNKGTHVAITILEVKDKFKPISQFIKPEILKNKENKKKMKETKTKLCLDCGKESEVNKLSSKVNEVENGFYKKNF